MKVAHDHRRVIPAAVQITPQVSHQPRLVHARFRPTALALMSWLSISSGSDPDCRLAIKTSPSTHDVGPASCGPFGFGAPGAHRRSEKPFARMLDQSTQKPNKHPRRKCLLNTMNARSPRLVIAERTFAPKRLPVPGRIGVCPLGAYDREL